MREFCAQSCSFCIENGNDPKENDQGWSEELQKLTVNSNSSSTTSDRSSSNPMDPEEPLLDDVEFKNYSLTILKALDRLKVRAVQNLRNVAGNFSRTSLPLTSKRKMDNAHNQ